MAAEGSRSLQRRQRERSFLAAGLVIAIAASPGLASAFCRTSSCPDVGTATVCTPSQSNDCGLPIFWPSPCVSFSLQRDASKQVSLDTAEDVFTKAFAAWTSAQCPGGGVPRLEIVDLGPIECASHEYNQSDELGNANAIIFRDDRWPHADAGSTLALTTVTYNVNNGEIYDADMEINSAEIQLTTGDTGAAFDLRSIATHEVGHFLGLSHSSVNDATMTAEYEPGTTDLRDLSDDDEAAICAVYPPTTPVPDACDATPRHGFSSKCADDVEQETAAGCCAVAASASAAGPGGDLLRGAAGRAGGLLVFAALALAVRRRADRQRPSGRA